MKILFIDHDGVICLPTEHGGRFKKQKKWGERKLSMTPSEVPIQYRFDNFNKKSVKVLNRILEMTDAEMVVSSDWRRWANLEELGEYYELQGVIKKPVSLTPFYKDVQEEMEESTKDFPFHRHYIDEQTRVLEVTKWLIDHPEIEQWLAIDDMVLGDKFYAYPGAKTMVDRDWGLKNFVKTNPYMGIQQSGLADKIIKHFE